MVLRRLLTLRRHSSTDFDVRFLDDHPRLNRLPSRATVFGSEHPFAIGIRQPVDGNDADASLVIAAVARSEANTPSGLLESASLALSES